MGTLLAFRNFSLGLKFCEIDCPTGTEFTEEFWDLIIVADFNL